MGVNHSGLTRSFAYDSLKRLIAAFNPENSSASIPPQLSCSGTGGSNWTTCYSYDSAGNLLTKTDNRNVSVAYSCDSLNRMTSKVYSGGAATPSAYYCYDGSYNSAENAVCQNAPSPSYAAGRLTAVYNSNSATLYTSFDALGRITGHTQVTAGNTYSFSYVYNSAGDLVCEQYPSGRLVLTSYDSANRVGRVSRAAGTCASSSASFLTYAGGPSSTQTIQYAPHGAPWLYVMGNNVWHAMNYNSRLQVCGAQDVLAAGGWSAPGAAGAGCAGQSATGGTSLLSATLNWYPAGSPALNNGNLQGSSYAHSGSGFASPLTFTQSYTYDNVNRLGSVVDNNANCPIAATAPATVPVCYSRSFGYDNFGNMYISGAAGIGAAGNAPQASSLYNGNNQLKSGSYDAAGNQTVVNGNAVAYDAENRQTSVAYAGSAETYVYDGDGRRVEKVQPGGGRVTVFVYDAQGRMASEYSNLADASGCQTCYLSPDHLGTARLVTDENGNVIARHDYLPFGEEIAASQAGRGSQWGAGNDGIKQKFTGKERDAESGLDYFGARYYGSALGRFTSPDPLLSSGHPRNPQSWNRYAYVGNNPKKYIDPTGLYFFTNTCGKSDQACNAAFAQTQSNVRSAYAAADAAYKAAVKSGDTAGAAALKRTLDGLGAEGQKNAGGQTVNISVNLGIDAPGTTSFAKGSTSVINLVLNPGMSNGDQQAQAVVAHEGVHAGEITPGTPTFNRALSLEHDAFETESYFSQAIGFANISAPADGSDVVNGVLDMSKDAVLWNPSWASADAATIQANRTSGVDKAAKAGAAADCQSGGCKP